MTISPADTLGLVSAAVALVSLIFAWRAVGTAERNNSIALLSDLYSRYHSDSMFAATQKVWELYNKSQPKVEGSPISNEEASRFVRETDRSSVEWKAVHDTTTFWRYLSLLLYERLVNPRVAFRALMSPAMLGFLYPVEEAFVEYHGLSYRYDGSLHWLYDQWKPATSAKG